MFITFEGIDRSGKTTIIKKVISFLKKHQIDFIVTREPGGTSISEKIRNVLLDDRKIEMDDFTEALLFGASRRQNIVEKILPAIKAKKVVICDRFLDSSIAYQGFGRELGYDKMKTLQDVVVDGIYPNLTFFLNISPEMIEKRNLQNEIDENIDFDRFESEGKWLQKKAYEGYLEIAKKEPKRFIKINANRPIEFIFKEIKEILKLKLNINSKENALF